MAIDAGAAGQVLGWLGMAGASAWAVYERWTRAKAASAADVAQNNAAATVADSQSVVYSLLTKRLETLESEIKSVREELALERKHSRDRDLHIWKLEDLMRKANLEVPVFEAST